jgi:hypothetical protein
MTDHTHAFLQDLWVTVLPTSCRLYRVWKGLSARNGFAKMRRCSNFDRLRPMSNAAALQNDECRNSQSGAEVARFF